MPPMPETLQCESVGSEPSPSRRFPVAPLVSMAAAVTIAGLLPFLRFRQFYLSGDSIAQWLPVSRRIGQLVRQGESHLMDPSMWRGGNFVAEARFGIWNPLVILLDMTVLQLDDLAVAAMLVNLVYLLLLSAGVYLLAREYGATTWPSALAGVVAATGGWTLWMDAAWWTPHLASLSFTPFVWVSARRLARGVSGPLWLLLSGALCVTVGNPYSNVIVATIVLGVAVEFGSRRERRLLATLVGSLVSLALIAVFVYLPFRQTSIVGFRESGIFNNESWSPGAGDFLALSSPTATPFVRNFGRQSLGFPAFYLAWFVLPLAPWLRWRTLWRREFAGLAGFLCVSLLLALGPSNFWLFRWPMRLVPYLYLPVVIALAVLIASGLATDRWRSRAAGTGAIVSVGAYLAWADVPDDLRWHLAGAVIVGSATAAAVVVGIRRRSVLAPVMIVATLIVLAFQLEWRPINESVRHYALPASGAMYEERFGTRYEGTVVQIADFDAIPGADRTADGAYRDLAVVSAMTIGGVEAVALYSGIGFSTHDAALCFRFDGAMCVDGWNRMWQIPDGANRQLADLIAAETIVVQRSLIDTAASTPPAGWELVETTDHAVVWRRIGAVSWPEGRLSAVAGPIVIDEVRSDGPHRETVSFRREADGPAQLTFARLAWPGYEAFIDGRPLLVGGGPAGLLTVTIPADVDVGDVVVTWQPPYWRPSLAVLVLGLVVGVGTQIFWMRTGGRRSDVPAGPDHGTGVPSDGPAGP